MPARDHQPQVFVPTTREPAGRIAAKRRHRQILRTYPRHQSIHPRRSLVLGAKTGACGAKGLHCEAGRVPLGRTLSRRALRRATSYATPVLALRYPAKPRSAKPSMPEAKLVLLPDTDCDLCLPRRSGWRASGCRSDAPTRPLIYVNTRRLRRAGMAISEWSPGPNAFTEGGRGPSESSGRSWRIARPDFFVPPDRNRPPETTKLGRPVGLLPSGCLADAASTLCPKAERFQFRRHRT